MQILFYFSAGNAVQCVVAEWAARAIVDSGIWDLFFPMRDRLMSLRDRKLETSKSTLRFRLDRARHSISDWGFI